MHIESSSLSSFSSLSLLSLPPLFSLSLAHSADGQGGIFFHNFTTGESTWEHPCDQFYLQQLEQEREKKKHLTTPTTTNNNNKINRPLHGQSKGMGGVGGVASSLRNVPPLAPLKAPEVSVYYGLYMYLYIIILCLFVSLIYNCKLCDNTIKV